MAQLGDLKFEYSGGAANALAADSIGGDISGTLIVSQTAVAVSSSMPGVTIVEAFGGEEGTAELKWDDGTKLLSWKGSGGATFNGQVLPDTGGTPIEYTLGDPSGYVVVSVVYSSLTTSNQYSYTVEHADANVFDDVSPLQSLEGLVEYRCIYLINSSASSIADVKLWIGGQPIGVDSLKIAVEAINASAIDLVGGIGGAEDTDPEGRLSGLTFLAPSTVAGAILIGTLAAGDHVAIWEERTVPVSNNTQTNEDTSYLSVSATV